MDNFLQHPQQKVLPSETLVAIKDSTCTQHLPLGGGENAHSYVELRLTF